MSRCNWRISSDTTTTAQNDEPGGRCKNAADAKPLPARLPAAWSEAVQHSKAYNHHDEQDRPACNAEEGIGDILKTEMGEHYRQITTAPTARISEPIAPSVKASETRLSLMKPRFSFSS